MTKYDDYYYYYYYYYVDYYYSYKNTVSTHNYYKHIYNSKIRVVIVVIKYSKLLPTENKTNEVKQMKQNKNETYERQLIEIANSIGMRNETLYVKFMIERFPHEQSYSYMKEWAYRFMSGNPTVHMDSGSLAIYKKLI